MSDIENKDLIQSYILTTAKYDFSVYEKRILFRVVELMQEFIAGRKLNLKYSVQTNLFGDVDIEMPVSAFLKDEKDMNYTLAKKALLSLQKKIVTYEDDKVWKSFNIIERPNIEKKQGIVSFRLHPVIASVFLDFSKGFRKYELKTAMKFESIYSMRFYELLSGQETSLTFTINQLKEMFKIENKYKLVADFLRKVINPAQKELNEKSPYSFDYKINKQGRKFHSITFYPKQIPQNRDPELEKAYWQKQTSPRWSLSHEVVKYLNEVFSFETKEIQQHLDLFVDANLHFDLIDFLSLKKRYILEAKNPKGYLISCVKKELEEKIQKNTKSQNLLSDLANKKRVR